MAAKLILIEAHVKLVKLMYKELNVPLDQLPYTPEFEGMYREFIDKTNRIEVTRYDLWRWLANARKAKGLPVLRKLRAADGGGNPPVDA